MTSDDASGWFNACKQICSAHAATRTLTARCGRPQSKRWRLRDKQNEVRADFFERTQERQHLRAELRIALVGALVEDQAF